MYRCLTLPRAPARVWFFLLALVSLPYAAGDVWSLVVSWYMKHVRPPDRNPEWVHEKGETVSTLNEWKAVLAKDLLELQQLEGQDASTRLRRSLKEQAIGQHCRPGQENVSAMLISPCSKRPWRSMNGNGTPTNQKCDLHRTIEHVTRQRTS
jgi:hypothetical protein